MPELPEIETISRQLHKLISGQTLQRVRLIDDKLRKFAPGQLSGRVLKKVERCGKEVLLLFTDGRALKVHLRMTGRLIWIADKVRADSNSVFLRKGLSPDFDPKHVRARFEFNRGELLFHDVRRFGTLEFCRSKEEIKVLGLDPMSDQFTVSRLEELAGKQPIKVWMLRQDRLVGIGNIYAAEILFRAGIHPQRHASDLNSTELRKLHKETRNVLSLAIESSGTTFSDYRDGFGEIGSFQTFLKVYARAGERCRRCKGTITKIVQAGRSTFFCKICQS